MKSLTVSAGNLNHGIWDEDVLKFCDFHDFKVDGEVVDSDFVNCTFSRLDWYWGTFFGVSFVSCRFDTCKFAGCDFKEARFIECTFENCSFTKDNLGRSCEFKGAIAYSCTLLGVCSGYEPQKAC